MIAFAYGMQTKMVIKILSKINFWFGALVIFPVLSLLLYSLLLLLLFLGIVTKDEFMEYMLVHMGKVTKLLILLSLRATSTTYYNHHCGTGVS